MPSTDYTGEMLATPTILRGVADPLPAVDRTPSGGAPPTTTTYVMAGNDTACAPGTAPHTWTVVGAPDPTGASAGALPCGGPLSPIWIAAVIP